MVTARLETHDRLSLPDVQTRQDEPGLDRSLILLLRRYSGPELKKALGDMRDVFERDLGRRWAACQALCFVRIPLFGCLLSLWNLRVESNVVPFREIGLPLVVSVVEVIPVLLMVASLARNAHFALDHWRLTAEMFALDGQPSSTRPSSQAGEVREQVPEHEEYEAIELGVPSRDGTRRSPLPLKRSYDQRSPRTARTDSVPIEPEPEPEPEPESEPKLGVGPKRARKPFDPADNWS